MAPSSSPANRAAGVPKPGASLRAGTVGALLVAAATATGGEARAQSRLHLPAADLAISLNALSRAAGVEILADPAVLRGRTAPAVSTATPEAALRQILQGTGLVFRRRGRTFLIVRAPRPQPRPPLARAGKSRAIAALAGGARIRPRSAA